MPTLADILNGQPGAPAQTFPLPPQQPVVGMPIPPAMPPTPVIPQSPNVDFSQPGMMEQFWNAWQMPGKFTGAPEQVHAIQQLANTQDKMVAGPAPAQAAPAPAAPAPAAEPARVTAPTDPADQYTQRRTGWTTMMERMRDPNVMGPLQTFFSALAAPMGPGENWASRLGRASSLATIHRSMLDENAKNAPREEELRQLEMEGKRLDVQGKQADVRGRTADAQVKEGTLTARIETAKVEYQNAVQQGRLADANLALKELQLDLERRYGPERAKLEMDKARADIGRLNAAALRDRTAAQKEKESPSADKVWQRRVNLAKGTVQGFLRQFQSTNPSATVDDFYVWLDEQAYTNPEAAKVHADVGILMSEGIDPFGSLTAVDAGGVGGDTIIDAATIREQQERRRKAAEPPSKQRDGTAKPTGGATQSWPQYK